MAAISTAHVKIIPEIDPTELDAAMVEAIAIRVAEIKRSPKLKLAKSIVIDGDTGTVTIDGVGFGYFLAEDGPIIERIDNLIIVNLRVITERAKFTGSGQS